jgi:hypothetical protein
VQEILDFLAIHDWLTKINPILQGRHSCKTPNPLLRFLILVAKIDENVVRMLMSVETKIVSQPSPVNLASFQVVAEILVALLIVATSVIHTMGGAFQAIRLAMDHDVAIVTKGEELLMNRVGFVMTAFCE